MARTFQEIKESALASAKARDVGNYLGPGSVLFNFMNILAFEVSKLSSEIEKAEASTRLSEARGYALDKIGKDLQEPRLEEAQARFRGSDKVVRVYTADGRSFLDNGISSLSNSFRLFSDNGIEYIVNELVSFSSSNTSVWVGGRSLRAGSSGNLFKGSLIRHNIPGFNGKLIVEQGYSIYNGRDKESDDEYLLRLTQAFQAKQGGNKASIERAIRRIGGIEKFNIMEGYAGLGTVKVIVQPGLGYSVFPSTISEIVNQINSAVQNGTLVEVSNPIYLFATINATIKTSEVLNTTEKVQLRLRVTRALIEYFNTFQIGRGINLESIGSVIKSVDSRIVSFSSGPSSVDSVEITIVDGDFTFGEIISNTSGYAVNQDQLVILNLMNPLNLEII
jgi:uncharacterized phage protein gp47/JayE